MVDIVRPSELDAATAVVSSDALLIDTGFALQKVTAAQIVDGGRPNASEAEAIEGTDNFKRMSPLRVKQAIDGSDIAINAAAALAAAEAGIAGAYAHRAAFEADNLPATVVAWSVMTNGIKHDFVRDDEGTAIESANGVKGSPAGQPLVSHWGELGNADDVAVFNAALASGFKSIEVPRGIFRVATNILMFGTDTRLFSHGGSIIKPVSEAPSSYTLIRVRGSGCIIENIEWDGYTEIAPAGGSGSVNFCNLDTNSGTLSDVTIIGNTIRNFKGYGITAFNPGTLTGVKVVGNIFKNFVSSAEVAPGCISLIQPIVRRVTVSGNIFDGATGACLNARSVNGTAICSDVIFSDNQCRNGVGLYATLGCEVWMGRNVAVTGNVFTETRLGVSIFGNDMVVANNTFRDLESYCVEIGGIGVSITGNTMSDFEYGAIIYRGSSVFSITGNTFRNAKAGATNALNLGWAIQLSSAAPYTGDFTDFTISGNTLYDCTGIRINYLVRGSVTANSFTGTSVNHPCLLNLSSPDNSGLLVEGNSFSTLVELANASSGLILLAGSKGSIKGNKIVNYAGGVNVGCGIINSSGALMTDWDIDGNTIDGFSVGINLSSGTTTGYSNLVVGAANRAPNCTLDFNIAAGSGLVLRANSGGYTGWADANITLDGESQRVNVVGSLAANRTLTLPTANLYRGQAFHITRGSGGSGTLDVGGLKTLSANQWCEVVYSGSAWSLVSAGSL